jgi:general stress protein 26
MSNTENLKAKEGVEKLKEMVERIHICLFCTNLKVDDGGTCRPMDAQEVDDDGNLWFFSDKNSDKNKEIEQDKHVQLFFSHPGKQSYLVLNGEAEIIVDRDKIEELWTPLVKVWFKEGKDDPNISIIKVNTKNAYYWDEDGHKMINFFKMVASIATGTTFVSGKEGTIKI